MSFNVLNAVQRKARINLLNERKRLYNKALQQGLLTDEQAKVLKETLLELVKLNRIDRSDEDVLYFMYEYFSDNKNPENEQNLIPAGVDLDDAPKFHRELCDILNVVSNEEINKRIAWAAPRGHAKSAYLSNCFPLHQIVFGKRKYILVISETDGSAKKFIEWIALQLKFNKKLREDFGELLNPRKAMNDNQIYVFGKQHHRVFRLAGKVDVVITDSPLILSAIYKPDSLSDSFTKVVLEQHNALPSLNFFIERINPYNPKGRCQDEAGAREIDRKVREFLDTHAIPYTAIKGTPSKVDELADIIKSAVKGLE
ncbi:MAG: hypothetical protein RO469_04185 [Thermincola sp.]|jgi:hypothetical protein|nr:hypothetical protein [Thermincola sp.]MDT3704254.1 hypothetical protein [Thermincola sp.]